MPKSQTPASVIELVKQKAISFIDYRFTDLFGALHHFSTPASQLDSSIFVEGIGFDGSSIRGFQAINESDLLLMPDANTCFIDPTLEVKTLVLLCDIVDPITKTRYHKDPRYVAQKAEQYLQKSGIADLSCWGPEIEFYIFNSLSFAQNVHEGYYHIDSSEGIWNAGDKQLPNLGYRPNLKSGYAPVPPSDKFQDLRSHLVLKLIAAGIDVEVHHHEVGTAGQAEIDIHYGSLQKTADNLQIAKYVIKNYLAQSGLVANFMAKPLYGDNGSGLHTHQSLWKNEQPLFYDKKNYALLSDIARHYIAGILAHAPALLAFASPTTNSYRRLIPGYEAPTKLAWSLRNRSACIRIPTYSDKPQYRRLEFRSPDPTCNPYLAFSSQLLAGLDGIQRKLEPKAPATSDLFHGHAENMPDLPDSLEKTIMALEIDQDFLTKSGVFTHDLLQSYIEVKKEEVAQINQRPHPYEFALYANS